MAPTSSPDTPVGAASRFIVELVAWISGPWAAAQIGDSRWWAVPAAMFLIAVPATFNTPGDKNVTGVPISGRSRIALELFLLTVAVASSALVWPWFAAVAVLATGALMIATSQARYRWLTAQGAGTSA